MSPELLLPFPRSEDEVNAMSCFLSGSASVSPVITPATHPTSKSPRTTSTMLASRKSRFFNWFKIRSKHDSDASKTSSEEFYSLPTTPTTPTSPSSPITPISPTNLSHLINPISPSDVEPEDQRDGFYQYGNSFEEDPLSLLLPPYQLSKDKKHEDRDPEYFSVSCQCPFRRKQERHHSKLTIWLQMTPPKRLSRPYTVSSEDWVVLTPPSSPSDSPPSLVFPRDDLTDEERVVHFGAVLKIFTKLFTMAKMLHVTFLAYGVHVCSFISDEVPMLIVRFSSSTTLRLACFSGSNVPRRKFKPTPSVL